MQQIVYDQSPYITLTYPEWLEAYNDTQWTGWVRTPAGDGPVIYTQYNIDSYLFAEPKPADGADGERRGRVDRRDRRGRGRGGRGRRRDPAGRAPAQARGRGVR